ncbi:MAG: hypothetical protein AAF529_00510 [Pseudomonadota bacterium]
MRRLLASLWLCFFAAGVQAEDITLLSDAEVKAGKDLLEQFNTSPKFVNKHPDQEALLDAIKEQCEVGTAAVCLEYLFNNRSQVVAALPDNPPYWANFSQLLEGAPFGLEPAYAQQFRHPRTYWHDFLAATEQWFYLQMATEQTVAAEQITHFYKQYRRLSADSETLIEKMIFGAAIGIAHAQMQYLMSVYAARGDRDNINVLLRAVRPFTTKERSLRKVMSAEAKWIKVNIGYMKRVDPNDFAHPEQVPTGPLPEVIAQLQQLADDELTTLVRQLGLISERGWSDYWRLPPTLEEDDDENLFGISPGTYVFYMSTVRSQEVIVHLLHALGDIHLGLAAPGEPQRPAPPYWEWSWQEDQQKICLSPTQLAQGKSDFDTYPACLQYVSGAIVQGFLPQH